MAGLAYGGDFEDGYKAHQNKEHKKAVELYQKSCDEEYAAGCGNLGYMYKNGQGVKQDKYKAKQLYGKSCDLKLQAGCDNYNELNSQGY